MLRFLSILCCLLILGSCRSKEKELFTISSEARLTIPGGLDNVLTHIFVIKNLKSTLQAKAAQEGVDVNQIDRLNPVRCSLEGIFEDNDYSRFRKIIINIVNPENPKDKREVFYQEIISTNDTSILRLFGSLSNVKDYLLKENYNLEVEIQLRAPTTKTLENRILYTFVAYDKK